MSAPLGSRPPAPPAGSVPAASLPSWTGMGPPGLPQQMGGQMSFQAQPGLGGQMGLFGQAPASVHGMQLPMISSNFPRGPLGIPGILQQQGASNGEIQYMQAAGVPLPRPPQLQANPPASSGMSAMVAAPPPVAAAHAMLLAAQAAAADLQRTGTPPLPGAAATAATTGPPKGMALQPGQQLIAPRPSAGGQMGFTAPPAAGAPSAVAANLPGQTMRFPAPPAGPPPASSTQPAAPPARPPPPPAAAKSSLQGSSNSTPPPPPAPNTSGAAAAGGGGGKRPFPPPPPAPPAGRPPPGPPPPPPAKPSAAAHPPPPPPPAGGRPLATGPAGGGSAAGGPGGGAMPLPGAMPGPPLPPAPPPPIVLPPPPAALEPQLHAAAGDLQALLRVVQEGPAPSGPAVILTLDLLAEALQLQQARGPAAATGAAALVCSHPGLQRLMGCVLGMLEVLAVDEQLVRLLNCLVRLAGLCHGRFHAAAGGAVPPELLQALAKLLAAKGALFEGSGSSYVEAVRGFAALRHVPAAVLEEGPLRQLLRLGGGGMGDAGFGALLSALQCLAGAGLTLDSSQQDAVEKALLEQLPKRPTQQVAALVGRYHQLGLAASRVMKKAAAEFARRPTQEAGDPKMLLVMLEGLAGFGDVKALPPQLLTRLCDELQRCMAQLSAEQLCQAAAVLVPLGCLSDRTPRLQQLRSALQQQLLLQLQQPSAISAVKQLLPKLAPAAAEQVGVGQLVKALEPAVEQALGDLDAEGLLLLVAALQAAGTEGLGLLRQLHERLMSSLELLSADPTAPDVVPAAAAAISEPTPTVQELLLVVQAASSPVDASPTATEPSDTAAGSSGSDKGPSEKQLTVLKQFLESHYVGNILEGLLSKLSSSRGTDTAEAAEVLPPPPPPASSSSDPAEGAAAKEATPPPPPPAAAAAGRAGTPDKQQPQQQLQQQVQPADSSSSSPEWSSGVWAALGQLLLTAVRLYPRQPPHEFTAAVCDVVCQAGRPVTPPPAAAGEAIPPPPVGKSGAIRSCTSAAAVHLLWGLAVAGLLDLPKWDLIAVALDQPGVQLSRDQLRKVFEAYSLVVLALQGPAPRPTPPGQLSGAQEAFLDQVLQPVAAQRQQLLGGLQQGGLLVPPVGMTGPASGQALLYDVLDAERQLAWSVMGARGAAVDAAVGRLLARWSWCLVPVPPAALGPPAAGQPPMPGLLPLLDGTAVQTLQKMFEVARLLPHLHALLHHQRQLHTDAATVAGIALLVNHLQDAIQAGNVPALLPAQLATLQQIAYTHPFGPHPGLLLTPAQPRTRGKAAAAALAVGKDTAAAASEEPLADAGEAGDAGVGLEQAKSMALEDLFDPRLMDDQELFLHNRVWLAAEDPWWFSKRLLVPALEPPSSEQQLTVMAVAAAAAALSVRTQWEAAAAEAARVAAEEAAAREAEAAAARAAEQEQLQQLDDMLMPAAMEDGEDGLRGRSPRRRRGPRHWRQDRSRSRSRSLDSGISSQTGGSSSSSGGSSEEEEGLISEESEEGEVTGWQLPLSSLKELLKRKERRSPQPTSSSIPTKFAARGTLGRRAAEQASSKQGSSKQTSSKTRQKRGRQESWDHHGDDRAGRRRVRGRSRSGTPDHRQRRRSSSSRSRSRSPAATADHYQLPPAAAGAAAEAGAAAAAAAPGTAWWLNRFAHVPAAQHQLQQMLLAGILQEQDLYGQGLKAAQLLQEPLLRQALGQLTALICQLQLPRSEIDKNLLVICNQMRTRSAAAGGGGAAVGGFGFGGALAGAAAGQVGYVYGPHGMLVPANTAMGGGAGNKRAAAAAALPKQYNQPGAATGGAGGAPAAQYLHQLYAGMADDGQAYSDVEEGDAGQAPRGAAASKQQAGMQPETMAAAVVAAQLAADAATNTAIASATRAATVARQAAAAVQAVVQKSLQAAQQQEDDGAEALAGLAAEADEAELEEGEV